MKITFPDGNVKEFKSGSTGLEIAKSIGERLAMAAIVVEVNGVLQDLNSPIEKDAKLRIITFKDKEGVDVFRHSSAHILAAAVTSLFKYARPTIGPAVENGFYYDFAHEPFTPADLEKIEKKMQEIIQKNIPVERIELTKQKAKELFKDNKFKLELIDEAEGQISAYKMGDFIDLCRGPHVPSTGMVKAIKVTKASSAYWKGDATKDSLQRIYGTSFPENKQLSEYLTLLQEAEKRDHRKLGQELGLFFVHDFSPGAPIFLPKGTIVYNELLSFIRKEYKKRGYQEVITPSLYEKGLWETSGHWQHYHENMFNVQSEGRIFSLKPMNCPSHCLIFKNKVWSYKELPLRIADFAPLHRNEISGALSGLTRVRKFSQDDAHIFVTEEDLEKEMDKVIDFERFVYEDIFKFKYHMYLATRPDEFLGDPKLWDKAEKLLEDILKKKKIPYTLMPKDGAFYGPKIDLKIKDALGREWQTATIQLDFQLPKRFDLAYEGQDGKKHVPIMIHRAVLGSLERFIGLLIEHFAGRFPLWLSPVQVKILPIADRHNEYAQKVAQAMQSADIRVEVDTKAESTPKKVRDAQLEQVNYILVVGDKEVESNTVNVRTRDNIVHGEKKVDAFMKEILDEVNQKAIK
ncbi:MAG TPA: threonine--tRNA ligase [Candidatus Nanoarchaeia archaeon]|nr:threonine--tRNA ligase [Candidatus Nanoarchaeia archaeon]